MSWLKNLIFVILSAALAGLILLAVTGDLALPLRCFAIFAAVEGFFELRRWCKRLVPRK